MRKRHAKADIPSTQVMTGARARKIVRWPLFLTRLGLFAERATHAFWRFWSLLFIVWAALSFGVSEHLSIEAAYLGALIAAVCLVWLLVAGIRRFRWPRIEEAIARLDASLEGRPLTAITDTQAIGTGDAASTGVWRAHLDRMMKRAADARTVLPDLKISGRDPYGFRYVAATALVMALLFGSVERGLNGAASVAPHGNTALNDGPIYEAWVEPPRYTGLPTIYLNDLPKEQPIPIPQGARVTVRLYGNVGDLKVEESVSGSVKPQPGETHQTEFDFKVAQSGALTITGQDQGPSWRFKVIPDTVPMIAITGPVDRSPKGEMILPFSAADDYGVVAGTATISLDLPAVDRRYGLALAPEDHTPIFLDVPLPFNGDTRDFTDSIVENLSKHPWAGLPVTINLTASDELHQTASAEPESVILPGRRFFVPLAAAIVEQRRDLLWNRKNAKRVSQVLRAVSNLPEDIFDNDRAYLILRTAIRRLEFTMTTGLSTVNRDDVAELLWKAAVLVEDGNLGDAQARLRHAQDRLSEALKNGATDQEIAQLTEELRRAMQDYLDKLARNAEQNPQQQQAQNDPSREITSDQLQAMLDQIQKLSREGRTEEAQQLLKQLNQMMENMRTARRQQGQGQGQQAMRGLQDTLRQQQSLADDAFRQLQQEFNGQQEQGQRPNNGQSGRGLGENGDQTPEGVPSAQDLARRQQALKDFLETQRQNLPDGSTEEDRQTRDALRGAETNMGDARDALRQGDLPRALDRQAKALDALRQGIESLGRQIARRQSPGAGRQGEQAGSPDPNSRQDPLGRQAGTMGRIGSQNTTLLNQDLYMRSRELMQEIRRRTGDKSRPKRELDYLKRLLDRF